MDNIVAVSGVPEAAPPAPELTPLDPRVRLLWWMVAALTLVPVTAAAVVVDLASPIGLPSGLVPGTALLVGGSLAVALPILRYRRWRYALRPDDLWIRKGVLWVTTSVIPLSRLQFVDTTEGPLERLFGLSSLVVHTAAIGTSGRLPGLDAATAAALRERLAATTPDDAAV